jgi:hypothetical protein
VGVRFLEQVEEQRSRERDDPDAEEHVADDQLRTRRIDVVLHAGMRGGARALEIGVLAEAHHPEGGARSDRRDAHAADDPRPR